MIGILFGLLLALVTAGCVAAAVIFRTKKRANKTRFIAFAVSACCAFALFMTIPFSLHTVQPGQVAVVKVWGKAAYTRTAGTYFDFWINKQYEIYDTTVQQEEIDTMCYSSDAQAMDVNLVVQYQIQADKAVEIANNYNGLDKLNRLINKVAIDKAKTVLSQKSAMTIIEPRATDSPAIETEIKNTVTEGYCVDIVAVVITNIDFSDAFEATVEDKMIAEQQQLKAEFEKKKAIIEAEKELEVAKLTAEANIAKAQGDAQAVQVRAQAEANALKLKSLEVARMMGFKVVADEATSTEEVTNYVIDFENKTAEEIKVIADYLKYIEYLEVWDGKLPSVVTGDSANIYVPAQPVNP